MTNESAAPNRRRAAHGRTRRCGAGKGLPRHRPYAQFELPEGATGPDVLIAHLNWLLHNLDYFALRGHATVQTATAAMHRDLLLLRMVQPADAPLDDPEGLPFYNLAEALDENLYEIRMSLFKWIMSPEKDEQKAEFHKLNELIGKGKHLNTQFAIAKGRVKQSTGRTGQVKRAQASPPSGL